jgi:hypothetical protein
VGYLEVTVKPEHGLLTGGERTIMKFYFKSESPTKSLVQAVWGMMDIALPVPAAATAPGRRWRAERMWYSRTPSNDLPYRSVTRASAPTWPSVRECHQRYACSGLGPSRAIR